ncbi:2'-5' RNA ligase family protein [Gordonia sp. HY285]|uniref:2'-5' RNA ligase family protein n=1 Tax=Gordonia liuliyuniae TaxID=2911517 RepID=UPI001F1E0CF5|nr:2'-5' RNA ligase family protein [Gordonia liuliyuniae]MCF8611165.1 2'-5' RNA ligase family protein [Gordonia liuliyuniae]
MAHSIELLLDDAADSRVRDVWGALGTIGLRTPCAIDASTVRPHCTLLAGTSISGVDASITMVAQRLPFTVVVGPPLLFSAQAGFTVAASVVPSTELLAVHARVHRLCGDAVTGLDPHCVPGSWTPHVTLARRVPAERVAEAAAVVDEPVVARVTAIRRWNGDTRTETVVAGRAC